MAERTGQAIRYIGRWRSDKSEDGVRRWAVPPFRLQTGPADRLSTPRLPCCAIFSRKRPAPRNPVFRMDGFTPSPPHDGGLRIAAAAPATPGKAAENRERPQTARNLVRGRASLEVRTRNGPAGSGQNCFCRRGPACEPDRMHHWSAAHPRFVGKARSVRSAWRVGCGRSPERTGLDRISRKQGRYRELGRGKAASALNLPSRHSFHRARIGTWEPFPCSARNRETLQGDQGSGRSRTGSSDRRTGDRGRGAFSFERAVRWADPPSPAAPLLRSCLPSRQCRNIS